jgi:phosphatidylinositol glycan class N
VIRGLTPTPIVLRDSAPARRVVTFIIDGLRFDKWLQFMSEYPNTFLATTRSSSTARWGISRTRVPTETRPGHVALLAGFYEDPSAVFRGWQDNPVDFDSVFNRSTECLAWGAPDVVLTFRKGGAENKCKFFAFDSEVEDFARSNASMADQWVFEKTREFFREQPQSLPSPDLRGVVFVLHLLGMDLVGHNKKPQSKDYFECLQFVDQGIRDTVSLFEEMYGDNETAFVITSDHGMTDWGSHGSGDDAETQTPLLIWHRKATTSCHGVEGCEQLDVQQADVASLISVLVGNAIPVNSIGNVPLEAFRTFSSASYVASAVLSNAEQVFEQVKALEKSVEGTMSHYLFPFKKLITKETEEEFRNLRSDLENGGVENVRSRSETLLHLAQEALGHYHALSKPMLMVSIMASYAAWFGILFEEIISVSTHCPKVRRLNYFSTAFGVLAAVTVLVLIIESASFSSYVFFPLSSLLFAEFFADSRLSKRALKSLGQYWRYVFVFGAVVASWAASFFYRPFLIVSTTCLAVWPWLSSKQVTKTKLTYSLSSVTLGVFVLTPVIGKQSYYPYVYAGSVLLTALFCFTKPWNVFRCLATGLSGCVVYVTVSSINEGRGSPLPCRIFSWSILATVLAASCFGRGEQKKMNILASISSVFVLLSIRHEALFLPVLITNALSWIKIEKSHEELDLAPNYVSNFRRAAFLVAYSLLAFFGVGNVASVNSFDPTSVYCFVTVFSPFVMMFLMVFKIVIPIFVVTLAYSSISFSSSRQQFLIVMLFGDALSLVFFCLVRSSGSWLEIGTSISHYVISMSLSVVLMLLHEACAFMVGPEKRQKLL